MGRHKLFLIDDSVAVQKVVQLTFADEGFEVEVAGDGAEALRKLEAYRPDVILLDVTMPGLSGYEVCRRIRQDASYQKTPVVLLVGIFEPFDEKEARRSGADDVLTKPFQSIREMVNKIGALLTGRSRAEEEKLLRPATADHPLVIDARAAATEPSSFATHQKTREADAALNPIIEVKPRAELNDNNVPSAAAAAPAERASAGAQAKSKDLEPSMPSAFEEGFKPNSAAAPSVRPSFTAEASDDSLLDLGESAPTISDTDDIVLDLGDEPVFAPAARQSQRVQPAAATAAPLAATPQEARALTVDQMSPEVIDAIARRVVEHLSTKILEDVAWEVVPQLAELLIKRQLESKGSLGR